MGENSSKNDVTIGEDISSTDVHNGGTTTTRRMAGLWQCVDLGGQRPNGNPPKPGCGKWNVIYSTKWATGGSKLAIKDGGKGRFLGRCSCGKKRSLEGAISSWILDRQEALKQAEYWNANRGVE